MNLEIIHIQGGMREFEKTGIYPEYLLFNLPGSKQNWRIKVKNKPQQGVLKSKGEVVYHYYFDGNGCKFRKVRQDKSLSQWQEPEYIITQMRD